MLPSQRRRLTAELVFLGWVLFILLTAWMVSGCRHKRVDPIAGPNAGIAIARAEGNLDAARANVSLIPPHANDVGKALVQAVFGNIDGAVAALHQAARDNADAQNAAAMNARELDRANDRIAKLEGDYWSVRQKRQVAWFLGICAGLVALWAGLGILAAWLGPAAWGARIIRFLPVANPFATLRDKFFHPEGA